jgi:TonB-dependent starch-binding outer membrane protein SusC
MRKLIIALIGCLVMVSYSAIAQKVVTGKVSDSKSGQGLPGVTVTIKGTSTAVSTESDGTFSINVPSDNAVLVISYVGYTSKEVGTSGGTVNVSLEEGSSDLNEVVVVGYGTTVKRELTGAIGKVKGDEIRNMPVPNFNQAIQGRAAGVFVETQNGKVGEGIKVRIRGAGSVNSSNQPLYVVDGIPLAGGGFGSSTADINFNDVESFEILKDAAASAIYGSRAANGVVVITTKRGKSGKTQFNLGAQYGTNAPTNKRGFLNAQEYVEYFQQAGRGAAEFHMRPDGGDNWAGFADLQEAYDYMQGIIIGRLDRYSGWRPFRGGKDWRTGEVDTNWEDEAFQDAKTNQIELSAQGGNEKTRFFISGSINNQDGILIGNNFQRMGARINLDHQVNNWLKLGFNSGLTKITRNRVPDDNAFSTPMQAVALAPITPVRDSLGNLFDRPVATYYNPLIEIEQTQRRIEGFRNQGSIYAEFNIAKGLMFHTDLGLDMIIQNNENWWGPKTLVGAASPLQQGVATSSWFRNTRWMNNNYLNYKTQINERHKIDFTAGFAFENLDERYTYVEGSDFPDLALKTVASSTTTTDGDGTRGENNLVSMFGRINYVFDDKLLVSASLRDDADSRFGTNYKHGQFWSASMGYILSDLNFMKGFEALSFLKPRISYGTTGNNTGLGYYDAISQYGAATYGTASGLAISRFGNDDLRWETVEQFNVGLDFGFFNNRLTGEIDYYNKRTVDMLLNRPVTSVSGTTAIFGNIGEMENKGWEFTLNTVNVSSRDFRWTTSLNISKNKNTLLKLDGEQNEILPNDARFSNALIVGQPIGVFYAPKFLGANPDNGDAMFEGEDGRPTRFWDEAKKQIVGDPNPDWFGGVTNTVSWKGLELSFLFQGVFGNQVQDGAGGFMSSSGSWFDNQTRDQLAAWKARGEQTAVPQARLLWLDGDDGASNMSSRYVYDASYVRLKNLSVSYSIPQKIMTRVGLNSARVYVSGVNLLTFTDYPGWDPEVNTDYRSSNVNQGSDFYAAPQIKSWVFGINLGF